MADNIEVTPGVGRVVAGDDIGGVLYQRIKPTFGLDGTATDVSQTNPLPVTAGGFDYKTVAASQTNQVLGVSGAQGDYLSGLLVIPGTTSPGAVSVKDGNGPDIVLFTGGASSVSNLIPFFIPIGAKSVSATTPGWKVTTGAAVSVMAVGDFT